MKRIESSKLKAMINGEIGRYLLTNSDTYEGIKKEIDEANKKSISLGYKPDIYTITCVEYYMWLDDNGKFLKSETIEQAVEIYPVLE